MKKVTLIVVYNLFVLFSFAQSTLIIGTNNLPPYVNTNNKSGLLFELMYEIGKEMNVNFNIEFLPWKRCESELNDGNIWGIMPYVKTAEREAHYEFSDPLITKKTLFFYYSKDQNTKITYKNLSDLKKYRIGGVKGYFYEKWFLDAGLNVEYVENEEQNLKKLYSGRIDLTPVGDITGWYIINKLFSPEETNNFHTIEKTLDEGNIYIMIRQNDTASSKKLKLFNEALKRVKDKGIYARIISEYTKQ